MPLPTTPTSFRTACAWLLVTVATLGHATTTVANGTTAPANAPGADQPAPVDLTGDEIDGDPAPPPVPAGGGQGGPPPVDLSEDEIDRIPVDTAAHTLGVPWWQRIDLSGFGAAGYFQTGDDGTRPNGGFLLKEAVLFLDAEVWDDTSFFAELQFSRYASYSSGLETGEMHAHFRNVLKRVADGLLGIKVGRVDIPFGEEYLQQDSLDNPLISFSAAYPYGFDEGAVLYGDAGRLSWIFAVTDGADSRSMDDDPDKALNVKLYGDLTSWLYASASGMSTGRVNDSAFNFGGSHLEPVGQGSRSPLDMSSAGSSTSQQIAAKLYEVHVRLSRPGLGRVAVGAGGAFVRDDDPGFDRDLRWLVVEPVIDIGHAYYLAGRYSEIGTYDDAAGYHFHGKISAGGHDFGYDAQRLRRVSAGFGWRPHARALVKVEVGRDWIDLIDASPLDPGDRRTSFASELVVAF